MSRFDITEVIVEVIIVDAFESEITSFKHRKSGDELNFGLVGMDMNDFCNNRIEMPVEPGRYAMKADWDDDKELFVSVYDVVKV
ncbi:hypothetical protein EBB07_28305 [Paenibacillaceae bacterium]|nr:hypothetical protein EBB07_28305 [Paenibacillaceae bacterium]